MSFLKKWKGTALGAVAAPFTGGLSLAGGYLYDSVKQQNEANKKAIDRANAYDMYTWDLANEYNDPKAQMQRLAAAGLNPNLVYGSGNVTGNTSGVAGSNGVASQTGIAGGMLEKGLPLAQGLANLRNTNSQNELLQYQMEKTDADRLFTEAQTTNLNNFLEGKRSTYDGWISKTASQAGLNLFNLLTSDPGRGPDGGSLNPFRFVSEGIADIVYQLANTSASDLAYSMFGGIYDWRAGEGERRWFK